MTRELIRVFGRIGLLSFGGPAAQISLMHRELVEKRDWLTEPQFLKALSFCMLLPGPEAMQLATYAGWKKNGVPGGLIGGGLFILPGALVIVGLALAYGAYGTLPWVQAMFLGIKASVVVIVVEALLKIAKKALVRPIHIFIAITSFAALFLFAVPFPFVIAGAAVMGAVLHQKYTPVAKPGVISLRGSLRTLLVGGILWAAPMIALSLIKDRFLTDIGIFFSKLAVVTFGGAYAVLAYMTQEVVLSYQWLSTPQMMDALGLAETTPGPLILVTQFVAMVAGAAQGGIGLALAAGAVALWVTFLPCFIWIFAGAPLIDWLDGRPRLRGALSGITAAVVGVIANLSLWFALHIFFAEIKAVNEGPLNTIFPVLSTIQPSTLALAFVAGSLLLWKRWPLPVVLLLSAALGLGMGAATGTI